LDLAICTEVPQPDARAAHAGRAPITSRRLFAESWVAVLPRSAAVEAGASLSTWDAFKAHIDTLANRSDAPGALPLIRYSQRSVIGQQVERLLRHVGLRAPRRFEFDATDPLLSLVAAGLGWAISTPLCLWQSRAWLGDVQVLPLPRIASAALGRREFFLLGHAGTLAGLDDEVVRVTRQVLTHQAWPDLRRLMPALPDDVIELDAERGPDAAEASDPAAGAAPA
ncbi:MAG: LysR family transcriptional regulator substrate-binding protein, partial [Leptothrix sp. (in: b-proteobacteria)]